MKALLFFEDKLIKTIDNWQGGHTAKIPIREVMRIAIDDEDLSNTPSTIKLVFKIEDMGGRHYIYKFVGYER